MASMRSPASAARSGLVQIAASAALSAGVPVDNDIGLFFASLGRADWARFDTVPRVVAVTGSNGKSTTAALLHHILNEAGVETQLAGNIGRGVFDLEPAEDGEVVVLELSSYQTELARALTPDIAVFTNLSPDHLDRHAGMGGYFAAKRRLRSHHSVYVTNETLRGLYRYWEIVQSGYVNLTASICFHSRVTEFNGCTWWQITYHDGTDTRRVET